ncbi:unnamed protein product [Cunninghamella blakesleeana]
MTLACERCRSKKVKCDFSHPVCKRCEQAKGNDNNNNNNIINNNNNSIINNNNIIPCSYIGSSTQVDLFSLVKMNETVDFLQQKIKSLESKMENDNINDKKKDNAHDKNSDNDDDSNNNNKIILPIQNDETTNDISIKQLSELGNDDNKILQGLLNAANSRWNLSLTTTGLRIDTNIISMHDLYDLLLTGMSQMEINDSLMDNLSSDNEGSNQSVSSSSGSSIMDGSSATTTTTVRRTALLKKKPLWKTGLKVFPLYSSWESTSTTNKNITDTKIPKSTLDTMMDIYTECFLCLPSPELYGSVIDRYRKGQLDEMLENIIFAWTARHGAIYHNLFPGQDPNQVGEPFFNNAKMILRERFLESNVDTMHSLLMMYIYTLGDPSSHAESEAYMYLGLANRMCLDLKMHCELPNSYNEIDREKNRRYYGVLNFLETLCTVHSDKPFSFPPHDTVTVGFPTVMPHETGEIRWRVEFMINRFRITRIYREIIFKTAQEKPLLSTISVLDKELKEWYQQLPSYFKYKSGDAFKRNWKSKSFREQACIKLNFEYNFQMCQLYGLFFSRACDKNESPSAIDVLSKELCIRSAETIVELLSCWVQLEQRWCHFSLETFMIVVIIYGTILVNATDDEKESAKQNLSNMVHMLVHSPVSHHKHVIGLINRVQQMFLEYFNEKLNLNIAKRNGTKREHNNNNIINNDGSSLQTNILFENSSSSISSPLPSSPSLSTTTSTKLINTPTDSPPLKSRKTQTSITASSSSLSSHTHSFDTSSPSPNATTQQEIIVSEYRNNAHENNSYFNSFYTSNQNMILNLQTGTSPFDLHKANSLSIMTTSDLPFSDFLYTPTLIGLQSTTTALNNNNDDHHHHDHHHNDNNSNNNSDNDINSIDNDNTNTQISHYQHYQTNQSQNSAIAIPMTSTNLVTLPGTNPLMPSQANIGFPNYHVPQSHPIQHSHWQSRLLPSTPSISTSSTYTTTTTSSSSSSSATTNVPIMTMASIPSTTALPSHQYHPQQQQQENDTTSSLFVSLPPSQTSTNVMHYHANVNSSSHVPNVTSSFTPTNPFMEMDNSFEQNTDLKVDEQKNHGFNYC